MNKEVFFEGIGRRKTSIARVRLFEGKAKSVINDKPYDEYFYTGENAKNAIKPLTLLGLEGKYHFIVKVTGGGLTGQVEAIQLGIGRALYKMNPELKPELRKAGYVTRDSRMVERKKYHQVKARKKGQFSKR
ncbi:MAG TPA: 30S ribosomal protein S9 [Candidatus Dojkabacteria bacterium]|nr:30S ribosomal protein S9 [Candidatus Dojkabacteria bacterium]